MKITLLFALAISAALTSCTFNLGSSNTQAPNAPAANAATPRANEAKSTNVAAAATPAKAAASTCPEPKLASKRYIKSQSFPFDYKPFRGTCFATFANKNDMVDERDVPRGSTFYIYEDGEQIYEFPDAFGGTSACWVEGVAFEDLNGDGLTDVVIAGRCLGAKDSYPSNAIYVNTGVDFKTDDNANSNLSELKSLADIKSYVRKHLGMFFDE